MLYREALGHTIRQMRNEQNLTLRKVATKTPMALGYLSEVERGQKELSSEFLEGLASALGTDVGNLVFEVAWTLQTYNNLQIEAEELATV